MAEKHSDIFDVSNLLNEIDNLTEPKVLNIKNIIDIMLNSNSKIVTFTGAGISTAAGIPDFRSENGLYNIVQSKLNITNPELVFDLNYFKKDPTVFYCIAKEFIQKEYKPTLTHCFLKLLEIKGLLLRNFTQNVDGLDSKVGISNDINVECHGHFKTGHCLSCNKKYSFEEMNRKLAGEEFIKCENTSCFGLVKPDIILFGESLPDKVFENLSKISEANLIIIMGSSLRVAPFNQFIHLANKEAPYLTINNEEPIGSNFGYSKNNYFLQSSCDEGVKKICELLRWTSDLDEIYCKFH